MCQEHASLRGVQTWGVAAVLWCMDAMKLSFSSEATCMSSLHTSIGASTSGRRTGASLSVLDTCSV